MKLVIYGQKLLIPLGFSIHPDLFDDKKRRVKSKCKQANDYNALIDHELSRVHKIMTDFRLRDQQLTKQIFLEEYHNPDLRRDFIRFFEREVEKRDIRQTTRRSNRKTLQKLKRFRDELPFHNLTPGFLEDFESYLRHDLGNCKNTRACDMKHLKIYIRLALRRGIKFEDPFQAYQISMTPTNPTFLTEEEVNRLIRYYHDEHTPRTHRNVLQYFLFACFTGLRISDLRLVNYEDIQNNCLVLTPSKTRSYQKQVSIPLSDAAWDYITVESGPLFHCYSDQVSNRFLKEVAFACDIQKNITTHVGRHTFATLALSKGMRLEYVSEVLGHSSIKTTEIYKHILGHDVEKQMQPFNEMSWDRQLKAVRKRS